jgi:cytochrome c peroxidase
MDRDRIAGHAGADRCTVRVDTRLGMRLAVFLFVLVPMSACKKDPGLPNEEMDTPFALQLPVGFPPPIAPEENPLTTASVQLGKALFFDPRLSRDGSISCASCHLPQLAFSDGLSRSIGIEGRTGMRNSPSLGNVAYHSSFFRDGGVPTLEQQVIAPIHDPVEMDYDIQRAAADLRDREPYKRLSMLAYGKPLDAWVLSRAIANYERTLISGWSRWDRWMQGDAGAMSESEVRGWQLFSSADLNCAGCHSGFDLSDHGFHNIGQYMAYTDPGRERISLRPEDLGKFKTPSLRNVALTAPYMHDGAMATLDQVLDHFTTGGQPHPNRSALLRTFVLDAQQRADLLAFLNALNDERSLDQVP